MEEIREAVLFDGTRLPYVVKDDPPRGGMKYTYFAPDRSYVVQFFNDPKVTSDPNIEMRLNAIIGKYNPTKPENMGGARGNDEKTSAYFSKCFCWPTATIKSPEFGIVCPTYPSNFFFKAGDSVQLELEGKDKKSNWFTTRNRRYLKKSALGDFRTMLQMAIILSRAVRRMHQAGLAHSDLSNNNVLVDPASGGCVIIDIDSLVVPGLFPPEVVGTRGYMAPEVLSTLALHPKDPNRKHPCNYTDLHALAVLIYEYLFFRHPLLGPKIYSQESAEEDDFLALGPSATFIENPFDTSNRPDNLTLTTKDLGPVLENLFLKAFVHGLHNADERPTAMEWEKGLVATWDLLQPCDNPNCEHGFFVLYDVNNPMCPFCETRVHEGEVVRFRIKIENRGKLGQWRNFSEINVYDGMPLFKWHILGGIFPDEKVDRTLLAYVKKHNGMWILVNEAIEDMVSDMGNIVPKGQAIQLKDNTVFKTTRKAGGILIEVSIKHV